MRRFVRISLVVIAVAVLIPMAAASASASSRVPVNGTFTVTSTTTLSSKTIDGTTYITAIRKSVLTGTYSGTTSDIIALTIHADSSATVSGIGSCDCTVGGRSGTLGYAFSGAGTFPTSASGKYVVAGFGGLRGLYGKGPFSGSFSSATLTGWYAFAGG